MWAAFLFGDHGMQHDTAGALVAFSLNFKLDQASSPALANARRLMLDTLGAAFAATHHTVGQIVTRQALRPGLPGEASVIGASTRTGACEAAFANGALANAVDFDEGTHLATFALAASLAMAERTNASGASLLEAFMVSFETGSRLKAAIDLRASGAGATARGFWTPGLVGPLAAALACARLLALDAAQTRMALATATCFSGGLRGHLGTMAKALHSGNAARAGLEAALLAREGFTADAGILDDPSGFLAAFCAPDAPDLAALTMRDSDALMLDAPTKIKTYPVCTPIAPALDALLGMARTNGVAAHMIASVEADFQHGSLFRERPDGADAAPFCSPYLIAAALTRGRLTLEETSEPAIRDPDVLALMTRIRHVRGKTVAIVLDDGRRLEAMLGKVRRLETDAQVQAKFMACTAHTLSHAGARHVIDRVMSLETLRDCNDVLATR